jgi:hypothetical protein
MSLVSSWLRRIPGGFQETVSWQGNWETTRVVQAIAKASAHSMILKIYHATGEAPLLAQLKLEMQVAGEGVLPTPDYRWRQEEVAFVDQTGSEGTCSQFGTADDDVLLDLLLHPSDGSRIKLALDACFTRGH